MASEAVNTKALAGNVEHCPASVATQAPLSGEHYHLDIDKEKTGATSGESLIY